MNSLHRKLQQIRMEKGFTFQQIEQAVGIPAKKMYQMEQGKVHLTVEELSELLEYYQLSLADISKRQRPKRKWKQKRKPLIFLTASLLIAIAAAAIVMPNMASFNPTSEESAAHDSREQSDQANGLDQPGAEEPAEQSTVEPLIDEQSADVDQMVPIKETAPVTFRFWGNILYQAPSLVSIESSENEVYEVMPLERVGFGSNLPGWLQQRERERTVLNLGTTDVYTDSTIKEKQRLDELGYATLGLDKLPQVYQPHIITSGGMKIGMISLARIVHQPQDASTTRRIGLPSAYDAKLVSQVIKEAKEQTDYLIVLVDWGKTWGSKPETYQRPMAAEMIKAGADLIVGNHPLVSHQVEVIEGKYVFYSLGHSLSTIKNRTAYNYVLEVDLEENEIIHLRARIGKMEKDGIIHFELTEEDKQAIERMKDGLFPDSLELIY